jgi:MinD-like ATPase involved in chromosome partitioning or flagellar assembly
MAGAPLHVVRRCVDVADLLATAASRQAGAAVVSLELPGLDAALVERVRTNAVAVVGVVPTSASPDEAVLRSLGIEHVAAADDLVSLVELVVAVGSDARVPEPIAPSAADVGTGGSTASGLVVAVWGPTGAPGRSTVAMAVAAAIASRGRTAMLIDADVYGGSTAIQLGVLDEISGLLAASRSANVGALPGPALAAHARLVAPGLSVLTGLPRADRWTEVKAVLMGRIVHTARQLAEFVVVDCGFSLERDEEVMYDTAAPRRNGATVEVLERADLVLLVGAADPVGLSRLIRAGHELDAMRLDARRRVVVNRVRSSLGWSREEVTALLGKAWGPVSVSFLPDDQQAVDRSLVQGVTLPECAPDDRVTRAVDDLVADVFGAAVEQPGASRPVRRRRATRAR